MQLHRIVAELKAERRRLDTAITALEGLGGVNGRRSVAKKRGRKKMSAAARKRLSRLLKQRWASGKMGPRKKRNRKAKAAKAPASVTP